MDIGSIHYISSNNCFTKKGQNMNLSINDLLSMAKRDHALSDMTTEEYKAIIKWLEKIEKEEEHEPS